MQKNFTLIGLLVILAASPCYSQNANKIWYFGESIGLDFKQSPPLTLSNSAIQMLEGSSTLSDGSGNLIAYTNGVLLINKNHELMENGDGLLGDPSSTNNTIFAKLPESDSIYYLFTIGAQGQFASGFRYSIINTNLQNGLGEVVEKNVLIFNNCFEKMAAVRHCNRRDIWITIMNWESDQYYSYLLTPNGLNPVPVISSLGTHVGGDFQNSLGTLKFSSDGRKLIALHSFANNRAQLMDFDNITGVISNPVIFYPSTLPSTHLGMGVYGAAFSPDNRFVYISCRKSSFESNELFQFDISSGNAGNISASRQLIWEDDLNTAGAIQAATDGNIYYTKYLASNKLTCRN